MFFMILIFCLSFFLLFFFLLSVPFICLYIFHVHLLFSFWDPVGVPLLAVT